MRFAVYHNDGTKYAETNSLDYSGELMGERTATISIKSPYPLDIMVGDYVIYRDEKFELRDAIGVKKSCTKNMYGESFTYSNIKLESYVAELKDCLFLNITYTEASSGTVNGSLLSKFTFNCNNVMDLASRIQANLDRFYGEDVWSVKVLAYANTLDLKNNVLTYVDANESVAKVIGETDINLDASDNSCYEMLQKVYDTFDVQYVVDKGARVIRICSKGNTLLSQGVSLKDFYYGKGKGLRDIEKAVDSDYDVVTILHVYGSEKNMPQHYYYNKSKTSITGAKNVYFQGENVNVVRNVVRFTLPTKIQLTPINGAVIGQCEGGTISISLGLSSEYCTLNFNDDVTRNKVLVNLVSYYNENGVYPNINLSVGADYINMQVIDDVAMTDASGDVNMLPISCLMLPKFSSNNLNPTLPPESEYSTNPAILRYGKREGVIRFDSDDEDNGIEEIYPTLEDTGYDVVGGKGSEGQIEDDGIYDTTDTLPNDGLFTITLNTPLNFDLKNCRPDGQDKYGTVSMKTGMCAGYEFDIIRANVTDGRTTSLKLKRSEDDSLKVWFPNENYPIVNGDKFVLTDIEMPDEYISNAADRLEAKAQEYLEEHNHPHYTYNISIDNQFMAEQHKNATTEESWYWNVKEGDVMNIGDDEDIEIGKQSITIDKLTIKESADKIPQFSVTLRNEKKKGTVYQLKNSITRIDTSLFKTNKVVSTKTSLKKNDVINIVSSAITTTSTTTSNT